ncbi:hypothetical protein Rleg_1578 [Rhizobium leguminosarum bv. trifolii WSM1325]|uniref:Uncharacterized protein n=1 Tax=Rhizobium leguminosarum bv. trifolii (strain WSM1325) TaxID=395491 RepID=C6AVQ5_RHILS|nr:hypothetical protein Rleg_1578 [Rhizobium leguminosarum bv. trifolii WSM1325]
MKDGCVEGVSTHQAASYLGNESTKSQMRSSR